MSVHDALPCTWRGIHKGVMDGGPRCSRRPSEPLLARMNGLIGGGDGERERARGLFVIIIGANKRERRGNEEAFHSAVQA